MASHAQRVLQIHESYLAWIAPDQITDHFIPSGHVAIHKVSFPLPHSVGFVPRLIFLFQFVQQADHQRFPPALWGNRSPRDIAGANDPYQGVQLVLVLRLRHLDDLGHRDSSKSYESGLTTHKNSFRVGFISYNRMTIPWRNFSIAYGRVPAHSVQAGSRMFRSHLQEEITDRKILPVIHHTRSWGNFASCWSRWHDGSWRSFLIAWGAICAMGRNGPTQRWFRLWLNYWTTLENGELYRYPKGQLSCSYNLRQIAMSAERPRAP